jgi:PTH1 family peptidyl-tRNA hydrolase
MAEIIKLIVGLGNPGERYRNTWHNMGARVVELLAGRWGCSFRVGRSSSLIADTTQFDGVTLMLPTTYMNRSGQPVGDWLRYRKFEPSQALVVYDDHDLPFGRIRIRSGGSSGGHNGMEDVIRSLGTDEVPRIKIGIQTSVEHPELRDQVLSPISKSLAEPARRIIEVGADAVEAVLRRGLTIAGNEFNGVDHR